MLRVCLAIAIALSFLSPSHAHANIVEAQGVELDIPSTWAKREKPNQTELAPTTSKGRAIEVLTIKKMPEVTREAAAALLGNPKTVQVTRVEGRDRSGTNVMLIDATYKDGAKNVQISSIVFPVKDHAVMVMAFVGADQDPVIAKANQDILASARVAGKRITVTYAGPQGAGKGVSKKFAAFLELFAPKLDEMFRFPRPLAIQMKECHTINAFYSPKEHALIVCHELADFLDDLFRNAKADPKRLPDLVDGTMMFVFFHELGHTLVGELGLPITGKGEDAADEVATIFLSKFDAGQKAAQSAMAWFGIMQKDSKHTDFADEHSLDGQRMVAVACLLYGADKAKFGTMGTAMGMDARRLAMCERDYAERSKSWDKLLAPYFVRPQKSPTK